MMTPASGCVVDRSVAVGYSFVYLFVIDGAPGTVDSVEQMVASVP